MKPFTQEQKRRFLPAMVIVALSAFRLQTAQASSAFSSSATLVYTISAVNNDTNSGNLTALQIWGGFEQSDLYSDLSTTGDGAVTANNPTVGPVPVASDFAHTFAVDGNVAAGTVESHHLGWFDLEFYNTGGDSYSIDVRLDYQLNAAASGENAESVVAVNFFNSDYSFSGGGAVTASVFALTNASQSGSSGLFSFALGPYALEGLYADVTIDGNLQASPVPVPGAVWLFGSAVASLAVLGWRKEKTSGAV